MPEARIFVRNVFFRAAIVAAAAEELRPEVSFVGALRALTSYIYINISTYPINYFNRHTHARRDIRVRVRRTDE